RLAQQRRRDWRSREGAERRGPGHAVRGKASEGLQAHDGRLGVGAEAAVDRAEREAVGLERELQRGDVPAAVAETQRARADRMASECAERAPGLAAGDAVRGQALGRLEATDGGGRGRAGEAVDG